MAEKGQTVLKEEFQIIYVDTLSSSGRRSLIPPFLQCALNLVTRFKGLECGKGVIVIPCCRNLANTIEGEQSMPPQNMPILF